MNSEKASFVLQIMKYKPIEEVKRREGKEEQIIFKTGIEALDDAIKALEKQIPKKIIRENYWIERLCPNCKEDLERLENDGDSIMTEYCPYCGQAIDWSE